MKKNFLAGTGQRVRYRRQGQTSLLQVGQQSRHNAGFVSHRRTISCIVPFGMIIDKMVERRLTRGSTPGLNPENK